MRSTVLTLLALVVFELGRGAAHPDPSLRQPQGDEIQVGPFAMPQTVSGVQVSTPVLAFLQIESGAESSSLLRARVVADLADLQRQAAPLVDTIPLPTNNCDHFGLDNMVARIWGKEIQAAGDTAILELHGDVEIWTCVKAPPCTKLEGWRLVFFDCNSPIKNRNLTQPFTARLPIRLVTPDPRTLAVDLGQPTIDLGGDLGGVTNGILKIAGVDINERAKALLKQSIDPEGLRLVLSNNLIPLDTTITRASFLSEGGKLLASVHVEAPLNGDSLANLMKILADPNWNPQ